LDKRLFFLMHRAHHALLAYATATTVNALGASPAQLATLHYVGKHPGCSLTDVAGMLDVAKSAVTSMVRRMEAAGLVRREPNASDGRGSLLRLTEKGESVRVQALPLLRKLNAEIMDGFSPAENETILRFFNSVVERYGDPLSS
jgi:MarR family transcriptional regulator, organic hydroperoxide resistance regulator